LTQPVTGSCRRPKVLENPFKTFGAGGTQDELVGMWQRGAIPYEEIRQVWVRCNN